MKLEDLVNIEPFIESMTPPDRGVFSIWASTATEISRDRYKAIARIRDDYMGLADTELTTRRIITFIEALLYEMPSDEMKKTLIRTEAMRFKKFV
jgi:hypothetical protein